MSPTAAERDALFQAFARALFKNDMDAMYQVVTPDFVWRYHDGVSMERVLTGRDAIAAHIAERKAFFSSSRFHDVDYHHLPDISFMTFHVSETVRATGERREQQGIERYTFAGGKLATKDVYRKPIAG
jgi:ketosteroid isomerase-like protein